MLRRIMGPLAIAAASVALAGAVYVVGTAIPAPSAQAILPSRVVDSPLGDADACLEAPVTSSISVSGVGVLCHDARPVRAWLRVNGLASGATYAGWLAYTHQPGQCRDTPCGPADLPGEHAAGLMLFLSQQAASPAGNLDLHGELPDIRLVSGGQVTLMLLRPGGRAGPHAQAVFIVP